mmetsp:Transcript_15633/g.20372  ORF Transcript_15633/g.20372 Transcript_15633/m.20372 type:complete len:188 (-) Transcript_15633:150-713(-)|eukprot:CAMPEP_0198148632 /NCGR_PEP_ID=MMETSP1443-20131203/42412_1 /TAXON_ID=186043 /ORGANISM="Entomoneis sp., Strain CCMP2396" /LENGTH=187 /DNA_ID=CAMNT_0043813359 /DNA_START=1 /DNA_END=564 /DNA_ORIENTATION=-
MMMRQLASRSGGAVSRRATTFGRTASNVNNATSTTSANARWGLGTTGTATVGRARPLNTTATNATRMTTRRHPSASNSNMIHTTQQQQQQQLQTTPMRLPTQQPQQSTRTTPSTNTASSSQQPASRGGGGSRPMSFSSMAGPAASQFVLEHFCNDAVAGTVKTIQINVQPGLVDLDEFTETDEDDDG